MLESFLKPGSGNMIGCHPDGSYWASVACGPAHRVTDLPEFLAAQADAITDKWLEEVGATRVLGRNSFTVGNYRVAAASRSELLREVLRAVVFKLLGWAQDGYVWKDANGTKRYCWMLHEGYDTGATDLREIIGCK